MSRLDRDEGDDVLDLLISWVKTRMGNDKGATMVEYGLLIVLIAVVASLAAFTLGGNLAALFTRISACLTAGGPC
jgi:pilus assembly protein Flp/PilA